MAYGDNSLSLTVLDDALDRVYAMKDYKAQFNRTGKTADWFNARSMKMKGKAYEFPCYVTPTGGVIRNTFTAARTGVFPAATDMQFIQVAVTFDDMRVFQTSPKLNIQDLRKTEDSKHAIGDLALLLVGDIEAQFDTQKNVALFQSACPWMAKVGSIYNVDGTTFNGGASNAAAYISITGGAINQFQKGQVLDIFTAASTTTGTRNVTMTVNDVVYGKNGPSSGDARVAGIGPGIIVTPTAATATWATVSTPAVGDYIILSGEFDLTAGSGKNIHGFPDWFDAATSVYRNEAGSLLDRQAVGNQWMLPEVFPIAPDSAPAVFDPSEHFRDAEDILPQRLNTARIKRKSPGRQGPAVVESLVAVCQPNLINEAVRGLKDTAMFTRAQAAGDAEARKALFGASGFDGYVYHSPTLKTVALQEDIAMRPNALYIIEPNSFFWLEFGTEGSAVEWIPLNGGKRWAPIMDPSTGRPTYYQQAAVNLNACLCCDQISANVAITGVKSSNS